ncbi:Sip1-related alpha-galactosidase [Metabacillus halosaccharovorans]|uniref:Sip1-related alpha-galactosidase n=1 Tax=Metabacillus halosaccharovorans TaxID=930124 RepID=UPI00203F938C|nr:Sip1-related alpha-galactosidase [Metabacillus halosaccharovorans]MCM3443497.1 alpha-galactosidase [Metabacillus halosaccharovorans]
MSRLQEDKPVVFHTSKIMSDISIEVQLDQIGKVILDFSGVDVEEKTDRLGAYTKCKYSYKYDEKVDLSFILHSYESFLHAYLDVSVHSERLFGKNDCLSGENGVIVKIKDIGEVNGLFAAYRHKDWWTRPHFNKDVTTLPPRTQSLLWNDLQDYYYLLPVVGPVFKTDIEGAEHGLQLLVSSFDGGRTKCKTPVFVLGKGENPFKLAKLTTNRLLEISGNTRPIENKQYPERLDYLGWCSWDAFYQQVNEKGILSKAEEFKQKQLPVKWMMIDDGWSQMKEERLEGFEPDKEKFPNGFKPLTDKLRDDYSVDSVGVWHTLAGYWGGVHLDSSLANDMAPYLFKTTSDKLIPYPEKGKGFAFWDAWHSYLQQQGIDFVKVDGQSAINNFLMGQMSIGEASVETHKALEASVGIHFNHCVINCMGMGPENIWNRPISSVARSSDDFVPEDENGFAEHALQNVYNSFYQGEIYWGDWDMFWTVHKDANRHALLRAISGGPIYTSDRVDETDASVLWPLILNDGRILRCDQPGRPTIDTLMINPVEEQKPLKVWNTSNGIGLLGVYNLSQHAVNGTVSPANIEGFGAKEYFVYDYFNQKINVLDYDETIEFTQEKDDYSFYLIIPKDHVIKPLGLLEKYIAPATFATQYSTEDKVVVSLEEAGEFSFLAESEVKQVKVNGEKVPIKRLNKEEPIYVVDCSFVTNGKITIEIQG